MLCTFTYSHWGVHLLNFCKKESIVHVVKSTTNTRRNFDEWHGRLIGFPMESRCYASFSYLASSIKDLGLQEFRLRPQPAADVFARQCGMALQHLWRQLPSPLQQQSILVEVGEAQHGRA